MGARSRMDALFLKHCEGDYEDYLDVHAGCGTIDHA